MSGSMVANGPCWICREIFAFDPDTVVSVFIDPITGLPPDTERVGDVTVRRDPDQVAMARAVRQPLCGRCVAEAAQRGAEHGGGR